MLRVWPLETATPPLVAPAGTCRRRGCKLSRCRAETETCWACPEGHRVCLLARGGSELP
jgi:hypothetical protein